MILRRTLAALALAIALGLSACGGDGGDGKSAPQAGEDVPVDAPEPVPAEAAETIGFVDTAGSKMISNGCSADLTFIWRADDPASVPPDAEAVIKVTGPGIAGTYKRRVNSGRVTLKLTSAVHRRTAEWNGMLVSVAGKSVTPQIPTTHPFLNTACGRSAPTPASSLPPGTPVQGAPCVPGQPLPLGFECK